jgi:hypothetical protein
VITDMYGGVIRAKTSSLESETQTTSSSQLPQLAKSSIQAVDPQMRSSVAVTTAALAAQETPSSRNEDTPSASQPSLTTATAEATKFGHHKLRVRNTSEAQASKREVTESCNTISRSGMVSSAYTSEDSTWSNDHVLADPLQRGSHGIAVSVQSESAGATGSLCGPTSPPPPFPEQPKKWCQNGLELRGQSDRWEGWSNQQV